MSGWAWVDGLLGGAPQFRRPAEWQLPQGDRSRGHLWQVGDGGRYYLLGMLNQGGQAVVWAALDGADDDRLVVVKAVAGASQDPTVGPRLSREARLLDRLAGERTVMPVLDWGPGRLHGTSHGDFESHEPWLALPYVEHVLLSRALRETRRRTGQPGLPADAVWHVAKDLASALHHLHGQDVVHRDLSPGNLLLTSRGAILSDLGMAWASQAEELPVEDRLTTGLSVVHGLGGTPGWYAPESVEGEYAGERPDRDPAYDVFPWGLYVFCAAAGRHPWSAANLSLDNVELHRMYAARVAPDVTVRPGAVDADVLELALAALSRDPADRPTTGEILDRLGDRTPSERTAEAVEAQRSSELESARRELAESREQLRTARSRQARRRPQQAMPATTATFATTSGETGRGWRPRSTATMTLAMAPLAVALGVASGTNAAAAVGQARTAADVRTLSTAVVTVARADAALQAEVNQAVLGVVTGGPAGPSNNDKARFAALAGTTDDARAAVVALADAPPSGGWSADARIALDGIRSTQVRLAAARKVARSGRNHTFSEDEYTDVARMQRSLYASLVRDLAVVSDDPVVDENAGRLAALGRFTDAAAQERTEGATRLFAKPITRGDKLSAIQLSGYLALVETQRMEVEALMAGGPRASLGEAFARDDLAMGQLRTSVIRLGDVIPNDPTATRLASAVTFSQTAGERLTRIGREVVVVAHDAQAAADASYDDARRRALWSVGTALVGLAGSVLMARFVFRRRRPGHDALALGLDGPGADATSTDSSTAAAPAQDGDTPTTGQDVAPAPDGHDVDAPPTVTVRLSGDPLPTRGSRS